MSHRPTKADFDRFDQKVRDDIAKMGWSDIGVFPVREDGTLPFNYTVGMVEYSHPDLIIMGMDNASQHLIIASAVKAIEDGLIFRANTYSQFVLEGNYRVAFIEVDDIMTEHYPMTTTRRFYGDVEALQIVWPDSADRFPWHSDFDRDYIDRQELLGTWKGPV
jgi:hypothetical protein